MTSMAANSPISKIISGGQTGVDRAALDVALELGPELGLAAGGWCPAGRWAEDGAIAEHYPLDETAGPHPAERTGLNVSEADGTLVLTNGPPDIGTKLTLQLAERMEKSCLHLDFEDPISPNQLHQWSRDHDIRCLNVAGPRESTCPGIYTLAKGFLIIGLRGTRPPTGSIP